jgi:hypothetical protein
MIPAPPASPACTAAAVAALLAGHGLTRVYVAACHVIAVISICAGLTAWTNGRLLWVTLGGQRETWPAADTQAAARLAALARPAAPQPFQERRCAPGRRQRPTTARQDLSAGRGGQHVRRFLPYRRRLDRDGLAGDFGRILASCSGGGRFAFADWDEARERLFGVVGEGLRRRQIQVDVAVFPPDKPGDRAGCYLSVKPSGTRSWVPATSSGCVGPATCSP